MSPTDDSVSIVASYETVAYDARPNCFSHPDHIAAIAAMFGLETPDVAYARILEVGCSDGANLLPLAATLPESSCVGCDLAPSAIERARAAAATLRIGNVEWFAGDLRELPPAREPFDYIVAHGVYSWVPAPVRDALFALAERTLAPRGVLFVSYNVFPGGHTRRAVAEMLHYHTGHISALGDKLRAARELAALLADAGATQDPADAAIHEELRRVAAASDSELAHDTMAEPMDPVHFHAFVAHAARYGLGFLAEAAPAMMGGAGLGAKIRGYLARLPALAREQYIDFARLRRYRQSLLLRATALAGAGLEPAHVRPLFATASMPLVQSARDGRLPGGTGDSRSNVRAIFERLVAAAPATIPVVELCAAAAGDPASAASTQGAETALLEAWLAGFVHLRTKPLQLATTPGPRAEAFALARWQAATRESVTNLRHESIQFPDPFARKVLTLLDGTRDRDALLRVLAPPFANGGPAALAQPFDETLAMLARYALLIR
jgi:SAM-dependent methyltransferase